MASGLIRSSSVPGGFDLPSSAFPRHPSSASQLPPRDSEVGPPRSRRNLEGGLKSVDVRDSGKAEEEISELRRQCQFFEESVKRLTDELARCQSGEGGASKKGSSFLEGAVKDDSLPPWLSDPQFLSPLLVAYDQRLAEKDRLLEQSSGEVEELGAQVAALVSENEHLLAEVSRLSHLLHTKAEDQEMRLPYESQEALARVELLTAENDLLVEQQRELERELTRLQTSLRTTAQENARASSELAHALSRLDSNEAALGHAERSSAEQKRELKRLIGELEELQAQLVRCKAEKKYAEDQATEYKRQLEASQLRYASEVGTLQQQAAALAQREHEAASKAVAISRDAEGHRDKMSQAARDAARAMDEAKELRHALGNLEKQLTEYKQRDALAFQRIKEAQEKAEEARLDRDRAVSKAAALAEEVSSLTQRLQSLRIEQKARLDAELARQKERGDALLAAAREEVRQAEATATDLQLSLERAQRDKRSVEAELDQLRKGHAMSAGPAAPDGGVQLVQLATQVARAEEAERARDEALDKVTSLSFAAQRSMNEWERERSQLLQQAADLGRTLQKTEAELEERRSLVLQMEETIDGLERANRALRRSSARLERRARDDVAAARLESEAGARALREKLDAAVQLYNRSAAEAETLLAAKDQLIAKWKEESSRAAQSFEAASLEQRAEIGRLTARVEDLTDRLQAAQAQASALEDEVSAARQTLQMLRPAHEALQRRASELSTQVSLLLANEEQLLCSKKELRSQVDRLAVERERAERQREVVSQRAEELARRLQAAEGAARLSTQAGEKEMELREKLLRMRDEKAELKAQLRKAREKRHRPHNSRGVEESDASRTAVVA